MTLQTLTIVPDSANYVVTNPNEVIEVSLEGGQSARRLDKLGGTSQVVVQWSVGKLAYKYLQAFWRTATEHGSVQFNIELVIENSAKESFIASFMAGTFGVTSISGHTYVVGATLEVTPNAEDNDADQSLIDVVTAYGTDELIILSVFNWFNEIVNVDLP